MREFLNSVIKGTVKSFAVTGIILAIISILMIYIDISDNSLQIISIIILSICCYLSAYFSTQIKRTKGLVQGITCAILIFGVFLILSLIINGFSFSEMLIRKLIVCFVFGIIGGIIGINTKKTNKA